MSQTKAQLIDGKGSVDLGALSISGSAADNSVNIDSSSRLLVGTSSARSFVGTERLVQIEGTSPSTTNLSITRNSNDSGSGNLFLGKSRGTANGSNTIVQSGDGLGGVYFNGTDGTQFVTGAFIACEVDGTPGANDMPGRLVFTTTADGASSPTERMRIDSSGRLLVGTSTAQGQSIFQAVGNSSASTDPGDIRVIRGLNISSIGTNVGAELGIIKFGALENSVCAQISAVCDANWSAGDTPGRLVFSTTADGASSPAERMRISNNGGTSITATLNDVHSLANTNNSTFTGTLLTLSTYRNTSNSTYEFLACVRQGFAVALQIKDSGNVYNTNQVYGQLSDAKLKQDIEPAGSQWSDIRSLQVQKFRFKDEPDAPLQIGLIAQEVEQISPGLIDEFPDRDAEGNELGTTTKAVKYSVLYMKAVKALQEAMERIEALEAKVAALEAS
jgi:hypothetical protein